MTVDRSAGHRAGPGAGRKLLLGGAVLLALTLAFTLGVLVGRGGSRPAPAAAAADGERKAATAPRRSGLVEAASQRPAAEAQGRLTFYQTLTAPAPVPAPRALASGRPHEDRAAAPAPAGGQPAAAPARPAPPSREATARMAPPGGAPEPRAAEGKAVPGWSVQVGAFRSRSQADGVQRQLAQGGLSAFVAALEAGPEGTRYRVRVGAFPTRAEAERTAERLRAERSLPTFVTAN